jgi:hypothetical protein
MVSLMKKLLDKLEITTEQPLVHQFDLPRTTEFFNINACGCCDVRNVLLAGDLAHLLEVGLQVSRDCGFASNTESNCDCSSGSRWV